MTTFLLRTLPLSLAAVLAGSAFLLSPALPTARAADAVSQFQLAPSTAKVAVGKARLSVETLTRSGEGFVGGYKVEVSPIPVGNESGQLAVRVSDEELQKLAGGQEIRFKGTATNTKGDHSEVSGTATPAGKEGDSGAVHIRIKSKKGSVSFDTTYKLVR